MATTRRRLRARTSSRAPGLGLGLGLGLVAAVLSLSPRSAAAWHDDGHRIVAEIAARQLSSPARAQIEDLLATLPEYSTMPAAATWPDQQAKKDPTFDFIYSSHYINLEEQLSPRELLEMCLKKSGCVALGITYYADVLRSERASRPQRAEALRFLIHFVGDVHQPLHTGHADDKGGNDVDELRLLSATPGRDRLNLHAVWDGGMLGLAMERRGWDWRRYAAELDEGISEAMITRWGRGSVYDWIEESRLFAAANGYLHADGKTPIRSGDLLGEPYYARNLPVAEQRLQQAGVRLALVLEEVF